MNKKHILMALTEIINRPKIGVPGYSTQKALLVPPSVKAAFDALPESEQKQLLTDPVTCSLARAESIVLVESKPIEMAPPLFTSDDLAGTSEPADDKSGKPAKPPSRATRTRRLATRHVLNKRLENCRDTIGKIQQDETVHYVSQGAWSMHELLRMILEQIGPATVTLATWSISMPGIEAIMRLLDEGHIKELNALLDWRVKIRAEEALEIAKFNFASLYVFSCHGKVTVIENDEWAISIVGSPNFTNNPRIEAGVITEDPDTAAFHKGWIMETIAKADPFNPDHKSPTK